MAFAIDDMIISQEAELEVEKRTRDRSLGEIKAILAQARQEGRPNVTEQEDADIKAAQERTARCKVNIVGIEHKLDISRRTKVAEMEVDDHLNERRTGVPAPVDAGPGERRAYDQVMRVSREERTYHKGNTGKGGNFLRDVVNQHLYRDIQSEQRLSRHMQEERVERGEYLERTASGTGNFAGLTVPQYLTEMYAPAVAALRPFANQCNHHDLPANGMTINISRITTPTNAQLQASENAAISPDSSIDDTLLTENVQTAAGTQTLSRQAIDRGTGIEDITLDDLFRRYATALDSTLINQATTGLAAISTSQTLTATTSPAGYSAMIQAAASVEGTLLGWAGADLAVMHSRRWYKLLSAVTTSWPMIYGRGDGNQPPITVGDNPNLGYNEGIRGRLANGLNVVVDNNVTTAGLAQATSGGTQDQIYVVPSQECHLWEDANAPVFIRAEQPQLSNLGVVLVVYGYFAYSFRRFTGATVNINGAGLVPPAFDGT